MNVFTCAVMRPPAVITVFFSTGNECTRLAAALIFPWLLILGIHFFCSNYKKTCDCLDFYWATNCLIFAKERVLSCA